MQTAVRYQTLTLGVPAVNVDDDDADLVVRAQRDPQAFAPLYDRYVDAVYRYCYRQLANRQDAEDATSQIFAKALAALPGCRPDRFRSWLFSIAHNAIVDRFRMDRPHQPLEAASLIEDETPLPEELAIAADEWRTVLRQLATLPTDQRCVVELRMAGLTGIEIAHLLGRSHAAVKMLQGRAVARLRSNLSGSTDAGKHDGIV